MNWFKMAISDTSNWDIIFKQLKERLKRKPTIEEVQQEILSRSFDDSYKEERKIV